MVRLTRNRRTAVLGGVAAGFGDYFDVDPVLVRVGFVLLTFATGIGILFYIICWLVMPADGASRPAGKPLGEKMSEEVPEAAERIASEVREAAERVAGEVREVGESGRGRMIGGAVLVVLGLMLLADRVPWMFDWPPWLRFDNAWPLILVALGVALVMRSREEKP